MKGLQIDYITPQVVTLSAFERNIQAMRKNSRDIRNILQILKSTVSDVIGFVQSHAFHRFGGLAGHANITPHAIHCPRS